jgi:hypothetical protein
VVGLPKRRNRLQTLALIFVSVTLLSGSALLFSAQLAIGKMLESRAPHDRAEFLRADTRYWQLFPLQLLAIALVAYVVYRRVYVDQASAGILRRLIVPLGVFALLLLLDYVVGMILFSRWDLSVVRWLAR